MDCSAAEIVTDRKLADAGYARPGIIILNPRRLAELPAETRKLIFLHECAHQHVGFNNSEAAADCWAIREAKAQGWLDDRAMGRICRSMRNWQGTRFHLPGPQRCEAMRRCFKDQRQASTQTSAPAPMPR